MPRILLGVFLILHGLVHLLYAGQSQRVFELQPGMVWPDSSWAFSRLARIEGTRILTSILLVLGTLVFVAGGAGLLLKQNWWHPVVLAAAAFSSLIYILAWDGTFQSLANKGGIGILINAAIVAAVLILPQLKFEF
jgi:hypothetical protein